MPTTSQFLLSTRTLTTRLVVIALVATGAMGIEVIAHHAFGAEFDPNRPVLLRGPVVKVGESPRVDSHGSH